MKKFIIGVVVGWVLANNLWVEPRYNFYAWMHRFSKKTDKDSEPFWLEALNRLG